jgi:hypothetical protein
VDILKHSVFGICSVDNYKACRNKFSIKTDVRQKTTIDSRKLQQVGRNKVKAISKYIIQLLSHPRNVTKLEALNTLTQATYTCSIPRVQRIHHTKLKTHLDKPPILAVYRVYNVFIIQNLNTLTQATYTCSIPRVQRVHHA